MDQITEMLIRYYNERFLNAPLADTLAFFDVVKIPEATK